VNAPRIDSVEVHFASDFLQLGNGRLQAVHKGGDLTIQGWVIGHNSLPVELELVDEGDFLIASTTISELRLDIAKAFPDVPEAGSSGFRLLLSAEGTGRSEIHARVRFSDGSRSTLGRLETNLSVESRRGWIRRGVLWTERSPAAEDQEKVLFGQDGWLYLRRDSNDVLGQQTGKVKLDAENLDRWRQVLEDRMAIAERTDTVWSCLVAADKESVYPEYLPETIKLSERRPVHDFLEVAQGVGAPVRYALDGLAERKHEAELYPRTDTHWNFRGAYFAYRMICRDLIERGVPIEEVEESSIEWSERMIKGDLGSKVGPEPLTSPTTVAKLSGQRGHKTFDNEIVNHGRVMRFEGGSSNDLTCVMFGESFAHHLLGFFKETFKSLVFVHTSMLVEEVLQQEHADVVVSIPLERFLMRIPDDQNGLAQLEAVSVRKGGDLPWTREATA
jgi:hypothetical protein